MTPAEKRLVDALDLAADLEERLAREQDAVAGVTLAPGAGDPNRKAIAATRGEAARAVSMLRAVLAAGCNGEAHDLAVQQMMALGLGATPIPSATLRTWAAGWRALAGAP